MKKRIIAVVFVCLAMVSGCMAEESIESRKVLAQSADEVMRWIATLDEWMAQYEGEDEQIVFDMSSNALQMSEVVLLSALIDDQVEIPADSDVFEQEFKCGAVNDNISCQTQTIWIDEIQMYAMSSVIFRDQYMLAEYSLYDAQGVYLGTQRVEVAEKDDEAILLLVDYDHTIRVTGRFAVRIADACDVIYTSTMGIKMDIVLDVNSWQRGESIDEWNEDLLLPALIGY